MREHQLLSLVTLQVDGLGPRALHVGRDQAHLARTLGERLAVVGVERAVGSAYSNTFTLPGSESTRALDLLSSALPKQAGDSDTIGMFGSGFKLAVTAAMRLGIDLSVYLDRDRVTFKTVTRNVKGEEIDQLVEHLPGH